MAGMYDNLGDMLNEALEKGFIPPSENNFKNKKYSQNGPEEADTQKLNLFDLDKKIIKAFEDLHSNPQMPFEEIRKNYHNLLMTLHPDTSSPNPETKSSENTKKIEIIQKAFNTLKEFYKS